MAALRVVTWQRPGPCVQYIVANGIIAFCHVTHVSQSEASMQVLCCSTNGNLAFSFLRPAAVPGRGRWQRWRAPGSVPRHGAPRQGVRRRLRDNIIVFTSHVIYNKYCILLCKYIVTLCLLFSDPTFSHFKLWNKQIQDNHAQFIASKLSIW